MPQPGFDAAVLSGHGGRHGRRPKFNAARLERAATAQELSRTGLARMHSVVTMSYTVKRGLRRPLLRALQQESSSTSPSRPIDGCGLSRLPQPADGGLRDHCKASSVDHGAGDGWRRWFQQQPITGDRDFRIGVTSQNVRKGLPYPTRERISALFRSSQLILKLGPTQMQISFQSRETIRE